MKKNGTKSVEILIEYSHGENSGLTLLAWYLVLRHLSLHSGSGIPASTDVYQKKLLNFTTKNSDICIFKKDDIDCLMAFNVGISQNLRNYY